MKKWLLLLFILATITGVWDIALYNSSDKQTTFHYLFNVMYGLIFVYGAVVAYTTFTKYSLKEPIGKSLLFYTLSLSAYAIGLFIWSIYNVILQVEVPYPGPPDFFFVLFQPLSAFSFFYLLKSFGGKFTVPRIIELVILFFVLFLMLYSFLVTSSLGEELPILERVLNITYPLLDALLASIAIIGLRTEKGALHPNLLIFVFAALTMVFADTTFSYRSAANIYWNGDIADSGFALSATLFTFGLINLASHLKAQRKNPFQIQ